MKRVLLLFNLTILQDLIDSMGNAFSQNKAGVVIGLAASVVGTGLWIYYKNYKNEQGQDQPHQKNQMIPQQKVNPANVHEQILKFKSQIDVKKPTLQNVKQLFSILARHVRSKTVEASNKFKEQRRKKFTKGKRMENMVEYFKFTSEGLLRLQRRIMELQHEQTDLIAQSGISQAHLAQYAPQLGQFMQELVFGSDIPLEDLKRSIAIKTDYLQKNGEKIVDQLINLSSQLSLQDKQQVPLFMNVIISDQAFENDPQLDKEEFDIAYEKFRSEITPQLIRLEKVLMPLMGRLQTAFIGQQIGENDMFSSSNSFEQLGGLGDFGGMKEQMMMQQVQQLRQSDPQAYEQLMVMMQAQMGR